ncbi:hypothetical protein [Mycobacteroides abscessus]|nr:hypothetical protein [Mycobacteroides abscessus]
MSQFMTLDILGRDQSFWRVMGPGAGQQHARLMPKSTGVFDLGVKTRWVTNAFGQRYQDYRFEKRTFVMTFNAFNCDKHTWADVATRLGYAFDYDEQTTLRFTGPDGVRDMFVRKESQSTAFSTQPWEQKDPFLFGDSSEMFTLSAELPFYVGAPLVQEWINPNPAGWFEFTFSNPGPVPVWPSWTLSSNAAFIVPDSCWGSPMLGRPVEDMGRTVPIPPTTTTDGLGIVVDSDPRNQTILSTNATLVQGRWQGMDLRYPVVSGLADSKATAVVSGAGSAGSSCRLTIPRWYDRPFGRPFVKASM